jgi:hypothetical protein
MKITRLSKPQLAWLSKELTGTVRWPVFVARLLATYHNLQQGIDSISLTPDSVMKVIGVFTEAKRKLNILPKDADVMELYKL